MKLHHKLFLHWFWTFAVAKLIILFVWLFAWGHIIWWVNAANENSWNNDNFIDETFWETNPTEFDIIYAIYWSEWDYDTAYTSLWDNYDGSDCKWMKVVEIWIIPDSIDANTIYLLSWNSFMIEDPIELKDCSSIISKNWAEIFTNVKFDWDGIVSLSGDYEYLGYVWFPNLVKHFHRKT